MQIQDSLEAIQQNRNGVELRIWGFGTHPVCTTAAGWRVEVGYPDSSFALRCPIKPPELLGILVKQLCAGVLLI